MTEERKKQIEKALVLIGCALAVYLFMKVILPVFLPFILAFFLVALIIPLLQKVRKRCAIPKGVLLTVVFGIIFLVLSGLLFFLLRELVMQMKGFVENLSYFEGLCWNLLHKCCEGVEQIFSIDSKEAEYFLLDTIRTISGQIQDNAGVNLLGNMFASIKVLGKAVTFVFLLVLSIVLLGKDYEGIMERCRKNKSFSRIRRIVKRMGKSIASYLKAQLLIMLIVAGICIITMLFSGNPYALAVGLAIGLVDALPFFGTGSILVPWAGISLLDGNMVLGTICLTLYLVCSFVRGFLEPKLIGKAFKIPAITTVLTLYAGLVLFGASGFITGPLSALLLFEIYRELYGKIPNTE